MKKLLLTSIVVLAAGTASAADFPDAQAPVAPTYSSGYYDWSGFHVGANVGYGVARATENSSGATPAVSVAFSESATLGGVQGGIQLGYNWQIASIVFGIEGDFQGSTQSKSFGIVCPAATCGLAVNTTGNIKLPWFGTGRARLGYAFGRWLLYATGGLAFADEVSNETVTIGAGTAITSFSKARDGWTVGGGIEMAFWDHWSAKVEYLYLDLNQNSPNNPFVAGTASMVQSTSLTENIFRVGANYKFGW